MLKVLVVEDEEMIRKGSSWLWTGPRWTVWWWGRLLTASRP